MIRMKNGILRRTLALLTLICTVMTASAGCAAKDTDYFRIGLEVTKVLDEMLQSPDYLEIYMNSQKAAELARSMAEGRDYDAPVKVYRLQQRDPREWLTAQMTETEREKLASLSPVLQEQLWVRTKGPAMMANMINGRKGAEFLAVSSAMQVQLEIPDLETEEPEYYLFVFGKGVPVLVTCGRHRAGGLILALDGNETESVDSLQKTLASYGFDANLCETP